MADLSSVLSFLAFDLGCDGMSGRARPFRLLRAAVKETLGGAGRDDDSGTLALVDNEAEILGHLWASVESSGTSTISLDDCQC